MLIDAGFPGARDGERIAAAAKDAGLTQIDYFLNTDFHGDHFGSIPDLVGRIPSPDLCRSRHDRRDG